MTKNSIDVPAMARLVIQEWGRPLVFYRGEFYDYHGSVYTRVDIDDLRHFVTRGLDNEPKFSRRLLGDVMTAMQGLVALPTATELPFVLQDVSLGSDEEPLVRGSYPFVTFTNGHVNLEGLMGGGRASNDLLIPHSPDILAINSYDFAFDAQARCPQWLKTVEAVFEEDAERMALLQEIFGYCLTAGNPRQRFFMFEGPGRNGKGLTARVLTALLGPDNCSNVPLNLFATRFQLVPTIGKLVNFSSDPEKISVGVTEAVKQFTGQDKMHIDRKNLTAVETEATAKLILSVNERPDFVDPSIALWQRLEVLPFTRVFNANERDARLFEKLLPELPGIFLWALEGRRRIEAQDGFTQPAVSQRAKQEFEHDRNPTAAYIEETFTRDKRGSVDADDVYQRYAERLDADGERPLTKLKLLRTLQRMFPNVETSQESRSGERVRVWTGIAEQARAHRGNTVSKRWGG